MIARQRSNLRPTFALAESPKPDARTLQRLARNQQELRDATAEFMEGIEAKVGPVPTLHDAVDAMEQAVTALEAPQLKEATSREEAALAALIKARQNLRQMMSTKSQSAEECRKFDQQQRQKLRLPKDEDKERLAKMQQQLEQLAKEERKFSEDVTPKSSESASESASKESTGKLSERQQTVAQKADELRRLMEKDEALTDLARERMDEAAREAWESAKAVQEGKRQEAGEKAADAAEKLERLARQVGALKAPELATKLGAAQKMAQQLGKQQQGMARQMGQEGQPGPQAAKQSGLAEETKTLGDVLQRLQEEAADGQKALADTLREAREANAPGEVAEKMKEAGKKLGAGRPDEARRDAEEAAKQLDALAQALEAARRGFTRPQLEKLAATEKQAAETQKALQSVQNASQQAEAEKKMTDLREAMQHLAQGEPKLAEAAQALAEATQNPSGSWQPRDDQDKTPRRGAYVPPVKYGEAVGYTMRALQAKIHEIVLKDVLLDKDEPVPPQFKTLVEEYYRTLSDDLRP